VEAGPLEAGVFGAFGIISRGLRARGTQWMFVGAALAAAGAYVFQVVGARALGDVAYAPISALWTIQYLVVSVILFPVETLVTRRTLLRATSPEPSGWLRRIWAWTGVCAVVLGALSWIYRDPLFLGLDSLAIVVSFLTLSFAAFLIVRGRLAGAERFKAYGLVTATESVSRAVLGLVVAATFATSRAFAWVMPWGAAAAAALWLWLRRVPRKPRPLTVPPTSDRPIRFLAVTTCANGILQMMLAGSPLVLVALDAPPEDVSALFVTLAAARVPLVFFFSGLLSRLLPVFIRVDSRGASSSLPRTSILIAFGAAVAAVVGGLLAAWVGGPLIGSLFGSAFVPEPDVVGGITAGVLLASGSIVVTQVLVAQGSEVRSLVAWAIALSVAAMTLAVVAGDPMERVVVAFVVGEAVALTALTAFARRHPGSSPTAPDRPEGV
jgi:O-antigen/teichoic acid export membrane protein